MKESKEKRNTEKVQKHEQAGVHSPNHTQLSLIVVGTETGVFDEDSQVRERILSYSKSFKSVHVIVLCGGHYPKHSAVGNTQFYPTNSRILFLRALDGFLTGRRIAHADVVSVQDPFETGVVGWLIARARTAALHVQVHTDFLSPAFRRHSFLNRVRVFTARFVLRRAARIRAVSQSIRAGIVSKYHLATPISILPIYVDVERLRALKADETLAKKFASFKTKVLVVSRLEREKNVPLAIRAFHASAPPDACLIIVGNGREKKDLEALVQTLQITERVFFEGSQLASLYYPLASVVLVPSFYEGYGLVIIEALACHVPVISTAVGVAREAGAITTNREKFSEALSEWFKNGPKEMHLKDYPYATFDHYVDAYCDDIERCVDTK